MSLRKRITIAALIGLSLATTLAVAPMTFGQRARTPSPTAHPAVAPVPTTLGQAAQTPSPTAQSAVAPASTIHSQAAQTLSPTARPALAPTAMTVGQAAQTPTPAAQPAVASKSPDYVEEKGFKGKIFEIKYRDPMGVIRVVQPLGSGFKGATMSVNPEFKTLTVRDFPENIAAIEEAIKRLDTPEAPRPDIEFSVHVLIASTAAGNREDYPAELTDVVTQLKSALKYKSYTLMTSGIHRAKEGPGRVDNSGVAESNLFSSVPTPPNPIFYEYSLGSISIDSAAGAATVQIGEFRFNMRVPLNLGAQVQYQNVGFRSPVGLRQGERVVVGSTTMGDKGLVVVVSAKLLK
jgi:hypothetical protein